MLYAVTCQDKPNMLDARLANRPAHLEWADREDSQIKAGGPLLDANDKPIGSLLLVEAANPEALRTYLEQDPYAQAGVFEEVTFVPFRWTINPPAEGL